MEVIKTVNHFVDYDLGVDISPKKRGQQQKREILEVVLPESGENDLSWGRKVLPGGPGVGGNYTD